MNNVQLYKGTAGFEVGAETADQGGSLRQITRQRPAAAVKASAIYGGSPDNADYLIPLGKSAKRSMNASRDLVRQHGCGMRRQSLPRAQESFLKVQVEEGQTMIVWPKGCRSL